MIKATKFVVFVIFSVLFVSAPVLATDPIKYHTTEDEMIEGLTRKTVKYRSFGVRGIKVVKKKNNTLTETTVMMDPNQDVAKLNVKIEFDYNSSNLKLSSLKLLQTVGKAITSEKLKNETIIINGHTDSDGSESYNLKLSYHRAASVKEYLTNAFGIADNRLLVRGFGEGLPLVSDTSPANKQANRRVEFQCAD